MNKLLMLGLGVLLIAAVFFFIPKPVLTGHAILEGGKQYSMETTLYYLVDAQDYRDPTGGVVWCRSHCDTHAGSTEACRTPMSQRGFYEDVRCQGSGVVDGVFYRYFDIQNTQVNSPPHDKPETAIGTIPQARRTIAVNNREGHCGIKLKQKVYIEFSPGNPWNGWFVAEDVGSLVTECHIDVFAGRSKIELENARPFLAQTAAKVWVFDEDHPIPADGSFGEGEFLGTFSYQPVLSEKISYDFSIYDALKHFATEVSTCPDDLAVCVQQKINDFNQLPALQGYDNEQDHGYKLSNHCDPEENYAFIEQLYDCMESYDTGCVCPLDIDYANTDSIFTRIEALAPNMMYFTTYNPSQPYISFPYKVGYSPDLVDITYIPDVPSLIYHFDASGILLSGEPLIQGLYPESIPYIYKVDDEHLVFAKTVLDPHTCKVRKKHFPFCMNTSENRNHLNILTTDEVTKKTSPQKYSVPVRIAVTLEDTMIPDLITGFEVEEVPGVQGLYHLHWNKAPEPDVDSYYLYSTPGTLPSASFTEINFDPYMIENAFLVQELDVSTITCVSGLCTIDMTLMDGGYSHDQLHINELYVLPDSFSYFIQNPAPGKQSFAIFAEDNYGNAHYPEDRYLRATQNYQTIIVT